MKKVLNFILILIFMITLLGCTRNNINEEKNESIAEINAYYNSLNENYYTIEVWKQIGVIVEEKKELINNVNDIEEIERIKNSTIEEISCITPVYNIRWLMQQFDFNDTKEIWDGEEENGFLDNAIFITLKKTNTYPVLDLNYFGLDNAIGLKYISIKPSAYFYEPGNEHLLESFRQHLVIYINPMGSEKTIETIRQLEKLDFIKCVRPNYLISGDDC